MSYSVEITAQADRDFLDIVKWLAAQHAGTAGHRWLDGLEAAVASLSEMPHRCQVAPEDVTFPFQVRQLIYGQRPHGCRILFTIEDQRVIVLHMRNGRRLALGKRK